METEQRVRWGILGVSNFAMKKVVPAMRHCRISVVAAIASRDLAKAQSAAEDAGIPRAYGSYEELLADPEIDVIYNPLPNHLHVPWSIRAAEAGKHVLCEKPISLTVAEARSLAEVQRRTGFHIAEAFMVRTHPQWILARDLVAGGRIGVPRAVMGFFSYHLTDASNIRNKPEAGGGALMDIGCYPIFTSRFVLGEEPRRVLAVIDRDPALGIDRLVSAVLDFPSAQAVFTCSTQLVPYQGMHFFGTTGRVEIEIPFNAPNDRPCRVFLDDGRDVLGSGIGTFEVETCDQYTIEADLFSRAVRDGSDPAVPVSESVKNMAVIEALFRSGESGHWETPRVTT